MTFVQWWQRRHEAEGGVPMQCDDPPAIVEEPKAMDLVVDDEPAAAPAAEAARPLDEAAKELSAELDDGGVPKEGRSINKNHVSAIRDLVRRLRAGEAPASIKVPRKPKSAEELFVMDKEEQVAARARPAASREFSFARSTQEPVPS